MASRRELRGRAITRIRANPSPQRISLLTLLSGCAGAAIEPALHAEAVNTSQFAHSISPLRHRGVGEHFHFSRELVQSCMPILIYGKRFYQLAVTPYVIGRTWPSSTRIRRDSWSQRMVSHFSDISLNSRRSHSGRSYDCAVERPDSYKDRHRAKGICLWPKPRGRLLQSVSSYWWRTLEALGDRLLCSSPRVWELLVPIAAIAWLN